MVGVGATPYYRRGQSVPETELSMACTAILGALEDAGLTVNDLDGFTAVNDLVGHQFQSGLELATATFPSSLRRTDSKI